MNSFPVFSFRYIKATYTLLQWYSQSLVILMTNCKLLIFSEHLLATVSSTLCHNDKPHIDRGALFHLVPHLATATVHPTVFVQ